MKTEKTMSDLSLPKGYLASGMHCGLKDEGHDLSLLISDVPCSAVGVFTQNHVPGEPVKLAKERLPSSNLRGILINSRYSNVATGVEGMRRAKQLCSQVASELGCAEGQILISSTGIIGRQYPDGPMENNIPTLVKGLGASAEHVWDAAKGIMTTDTVPKAFSTQVDGVTITVLVKGSGMICPNMATMLAFILTDAQLGLNDMSEVLKRVVNRSFNNLSIDFDTSTSDSCFLLANGQAGAVNSAKFEEALTRACLEASEALVRDGEGVTHMIDCRVRGGSDVRMVRSVASSVINSPLVKTMITGADPNWGRLVMAIGKVDDSRLAGVAPTISIMGHLVLDHGVPVEHDLDLISKAMKDSDTVDLEIHLHKGAESVQFLGANLTKDYVSINADYTT
jgi:glutamate N-acetyltransferase/amino-acid N-acetyltransferase